MNLFDFSLNSIDGNPFNLSELKGKKVMIVNTASECGYTPQFAQMEELHQHFKDANFEIIGIPSNDFGAQDPGTNAEIGAFCQKNYGVTFPMMEKIVVKGNFQHPLFSWLTAKTGEEVKWNFQKFLIDEEGDFVKSLGSDISPVDESILSWVEGK